MADSSTAVDSLDVNPGEAWLLLTWAAAAAGRGALHGRPGLGTGQCTRPCPRRALAGMLRSRGQRPPAFSRRRE